MSKYETSGTRKRGTESLRRHAPQRAVGLPAILAIVVIVAVAAGLLLLFPRDWMKAPSVTVTTERSSFSPNHDQEQDTAIVMYALSSDAEVSAHVLDSSRSPVRTLTAEDAQRAGQHVVVWDGRDDHGKIVMDGQYYVRIAAKGSARSSSNTVPVTVDTTAPVIRLANMPEDLQVKEQDILIEGVTEPDATLWLNNSSQPVSVDSSGGFRLEQRLDEGANDLELIVMDSAGNRSSVIRRVTLVVAPPDIAVENPPENLWINQKLLSVQGRVPPGTSLTVNGREATVDEEGRYSVDVLLEEGENTLLIEATDGVGNVATIDREVYLKTRPPALSLSSVSEGMEIDEPSLLVVGQTEVGASLTLNGRMVAVDSQGGFNGLVNLVEGNNLVKAEALDRAGNAATLSRRVVYASPTASIASSGRNLLLPGLALAVGTIAAGWLLLGGWMSPVSVSFSADRQTLSADAHGRTNPLLLKLTLSRPAKVTVEVWSETDDLVTTLLYRRKRGAGDHVLVWDGRGDGGNAVSNGVYEIEASARTLTTSVSSSVRVSVDTPRPAHVSRLTARERQTVSSRSN